MREQLEALKRKYIAKDGQLKVLAERVEVFQNKSRDQVSMVFREFREKGLSRVLESPTSSSSMLQLHL